MVKHFREQNQGNILALVRIIFSSSQLTIYTLISKRLRANTTVYAIKIHNIDTISYFQYSVKYQGLGV